MHIRFRMCELQPHTSESVAFAEQQQPRHLLCACCAVEEPLGLFPRKTVCPTTVGVRVTLHFPNVPRYVAWWQSHLNNPCKDVCPNNGKSQSFIYSLCMCLDMLHIRTVLAKVRVQQRQESEFPVHLPHVPRHVA